MDKRTAVIAYDNQEKEAKHAFYIPIWALELTDNDFQTAMFLKQVVFWAQRTDNPDGFYKSYDEWLSESRLNRYRISKAVKTVNELAGREVVVIRNKKVNGAPTLHYLLNWEALYEWICSTCANPIEQHSQIRFVQRAQMDLATSEQIHTEESDRELHTEIQTEIPDFSSSPSPITQPEEEEISTPVPTSEINRFASKPKTPEIAIYDPLAKALAEKCGLIYPTNIRSIAKELGEGVALIRQADPTAKASDLRYYCEYYATVRDPDPRWNIPTVSFVTGKWKLFKAWLEPMLSEQITRFIPGTNYQKTLTCREWDAIDELAVGESCTVEAWQQGSWSNVELIKQPDGTFSEAMREAV